MSYDRDWLFNALGQPKERSKSTEKVKRKETGEDVEVVKTRSAKWRCGCGAFTIGPDDGPFKQWHLYPCSTHRDLVQR